MSTRKDKFSKKDYKFMRLALNLANARHGHTGVNPSVGCVIVKNDEIISIGQTGYNGRPHAEYNAIKNSNEVLEGGTIESEVPSSLKAVQITSPIFLASSALVALKYILILLVD